LKTQYYTAELGIWIDELPDVGAWGEEFKKEEAREVVTAVGAWIFCFRKPVRQSELVSFFFSLCLWWLRH
jgi:hypothetical protein